VFDIHQKSPAKLYALRGRGIPGCRLTDGPPTSDTTEERQSARGSQLSPPVERPMSYFRYHTWIYVGLILLLLGIQVRMVETYVLTPESTRRLSEWFGPPSGEPAPTGALQRWALRENLARKQFRPPQWLGYSLLSAGGVMIVHGFFLRKAGGASGG
jgi:hypothetical protein